VSAPVDRIPVSLLTGFLGSGKTTLLNHWMQQPEMAGTAVLVNEFGEVGVDHHLVEKLDDQLWLLDSGCLCCAVQGDLIGALKDLAARSARRDIAPITRVIIETSGLADPVPVIYALMEDPFVAARHVCDGVITVVSAVHGLAHLKAYPEALRQVVAADVLFISKCDQSSTHGIATLEEELRRLNPGAPLRRVRHGQIDAHDLFGRGVYSATGKAPDLTEWLGAEALHQAELQGAGSAGRGWLMPAVASEAPDAQGSPLTERLQDRRDRSVADIAPSTTPHAAGVTTFVVTFDDPVPWLGFAVVMGQVLATHGSNLLRVKGLMNVVGSTRPQVIQCVQSVAYPSISLPAWPKEGPFVDGRGRLVFIARDLDAAQVDAIRSALTTFPGDSAALRMTAGDSMLATRCWLGQRMPLSTPNVVEHDGWQIQAKRLRRRTPG
jgi:G3E family GTPase